MAANPNYENEVVFVKSLMELMMENETLQLQVGRLEAELKQAKEAAEAARNEKQLQDAQIIAKEQQLDEERKARKEAENKLRRINEKKLAIEAERIEAARKQAEEERRLLEERATHHAEDVRRKQEAERNAEAERIKGIENQLEITCEVWRKGVLGVSNLDIIMLTPSLREFYKGIANKLPENHHKRLAVAEAEKRAAEQHAEDVRRKQEEEQKAEDVRRKQEQEAEDVRRKQEAEEAREKPFHNLIDMYLERCQKSDVNGDDAVMIGDLANMLPENYYRRAEVEKRAKQLEPLIQSERQRMYQLYLERDRQVERERQERQIRERQQLEREKQEKQRREHQEQIRSYAGGGNGLGGLFGVGGRLR